MHVAGKAACVVQVPSDTVRCASYEERYAVERTIGVGSHGVARLVRDRADGSLWVLKEVALTPRSAEAAEDGQAGHSRVEGQAIGRHAVDGA